MGRKRRRQQNDDEGNHPGKKRQNVEELPEGVHHYECMSEVPCGIQQYLTRISRRIRGYNENAKSDTATSVNATTFGRSIVMGSG